MLAPKLTIAASLILAGNLALPQVDSQLTGVVRDLSSAPVGRVLLTLSSLDRAFQTQSAEDGRFRFENVPSGKYELELSAPGFVEQRFAVDVSAITPHPLTIALRPLESAPDMNDCGPHPSVRYSLFEPNTPHVTGVVRDYSDRKPLRGATVTLWRTGEEHPAFAANSDQAGRIEFSGVPSGYYDLRSSRPGYRSTELKQLLVPGQSGMSVDISMLKRKWLVACE